jgi:zinc transport system substrate-binding protein
VRRTFMLFGVLCLSLLASACGEASEATTDAKPSVVTAFYPLQWIAQQVGGDQVSITSLTPEGSEPHDLTLNAKALERLRDADVVLYLGDDFQPEVQKAVEQLPASVQKIDVLKLPAMNLLPVPETPEGSEKVDGAFDPHVWLDPVRMQLVAHSVNNALSTALPNAKSTFAANADKVSSDLAGLDNSLRTKLTSCKRRTVVTSHAAFQYFAKRYNLQQLPIAGVSPEEEPNPKSLQNIAKAAKYADATTVYFEDALPSKLANTVAGEIGAKTDLLSALEFDPSKEHAGASYISVQNDNADRLVKGLDCTAAQ